MGSRKLAHTIRLRGVSQNNLKDIDVDIPLGKLVVVTGLSGTGKSSLVFETLHAEGQRRYVETFSPYIRQFLEMLQRPEVKSVENIRPSIAIQQTNTVKTSRSTVGTMTELCDFFKVWFSHTSSLYDPATGKKIEADTPQSIWKKMLKTHRDKRCLLAFKIHKPEKLSWKEIVDPLMRQGYTRALLTGKDPIKRLDDINLSTIQGDALYVIQDRIEIGPRQKTRFIESATTALHFGSKELFIFSEIGKLIEHFTEGLVSSKTGQLFKPAQPNLFSFNSPVGACPTCRGFGRTIEIDPALVIPDPTLSLKDGVIRPFKGDVYKECQRELLEAAKKHRIPTSKPWSQLSEKARRFVLEGEQGYGDTGKTWPDAWYGVHRFFDWLESKTYKMHVRVFLSKYRSYATCRNCCGARLREDALYFKWNGYTLPELYQMPISKLNALLATQCIETGNHGADIALESILTRLNYLEQVGLGYLTLNRTSRTLSGGETQRVNLTACLGTSLIDTLFVLDEPSIGLHASDIQRLIDILKNLVAQGNTVVIVEHDEAIMRAADHILELGPKPGSQGGKLTFSGTPIAMMNEPKSITGNYLSGRMRIEHPQQRRKTGKKTAQLNIQQASLHNIQGLSLQIPLQRFVAISGISGSGKSTLLDNIIYQGWQAQEGKLTEYPASIKSISSNLPIDDIILVDQSPISKTPRSNPALYCDAWTSIRELFAKTDAAMAHGMNAANFSFNSGQGRCEHCQGLGYERVDMQFLSDVYIPCGICEGKRFKEEVLSIKLYGKSVFEVLSMDIEEACVFFSKTPKITKRLKPLQDVGLGYLTLGQPLNTLSGGESQRLKLIQYLGNINEEKHILLLLDEPTTGLHRDDIKKLIEVLQKLVDQGNSLVVIEHQVDVLAAADWIIEMGPGAGEAGGQCIAEGSPAVIQKHKTSTAPFLKEVLKNEKIDVFPEIKTSILQAAEPSSQFDESPSLALIGAREHNLKNISLSIPLHSLSVVTGVSGSGKSSLAFDIIFAEGQRRFMESMSAYARQFVEQLPRADIDQLSHVPPTIAIEQRVTRGSRKSTVATITEVAQYLRLLYSKIGEQYSPHTGERVSSASIDALKKKLEKHLQGQTSKASLYLCAPVIQARKGHHQPLANWALTKGYTHLRIDGVITELSKFKALDRYREHDIELVIADIHPRHTKNKRERAEKLEEALQRGKGSAFIINKHGNKEWFSTKRTDPITGEAFPELDPKHFSWNSPKGWCEHCRGYGHLYTWMASDENFTIKAKAIEDGSACPACQGARLNAISRHVKLNTQQKAYSLPELLERTSSELLGLLEKLKLDKRATHIAATILPEIIERLQFMKEVGLEYLALNRETATLSGGEAQRIRLASQLGSNLSGALYILDEPSIGLHARDNDRLIRSLTNLKNRGNTLLVVEHDEDTMRAADHIIDLGPGAGIHGGEILAEGPIKSILKNKASLTGQYLKNALKHPLHGKYRQLPEPWNPRKKTEQPEWLVLRKPSLRNLKGDDVSFAIGKLNVLCGISGSGKSTLMRDLLKPLVEEAIKEKQERLKLQNGNGPRLRCAFKDLTHGNIFKQVIEVDQEPIGKTIRSTPATYIGIFDRIREFFASLPEAKMHGFSSSTFSFNTANGRCATCKGAGRIKLEMNFMPDTYVSCEDCQGTRYGPELLDIQWKDKNIADVLNLSFEEASDFFDFHSQLQAVCKLMVECGLGYLKLGQASPTLSGGEAQRLKLVSELAKGLPSFKEKSRGIQSNNLYLLEEPTIGLHLSDCKRLIELFHRLVNQGHTVIVIEHHLDLIAEADYLIEMGPEGGDCGGQVLYQGSVKGLLGCKKSRTAPYIKALMAKG